MRIADMNKMIPNTLKKISVHFKNGSTEQIMKVIMSVVNKDYLESQVEDFALTLLEQNGGNKKKTLKALWTIVRRDISYITDGFGVQDIKHPARTWYDGYGDCKSMSIFIYYCCRAMDIPCFIRFSSYANDGEIGHVYPIAIVNSKEIIVDAVYEYFNAEPEYTAKKDRFSNVYTKAKIKAAMTQIREIAGIGKNAKYSDMYKRANDVLVKRKSIILPPAPSFDISGSSEAMLLSALKQRKFEMQGRIAAGVGDTLKSDVAFRMRDILGQLAQPNVHTGGAGRISLRGLPNFEAQEIKKYINYVVRKEYAAQNLKKVSGYAVRGIHGPHDEFNPTQAQSQICTNLSMVPEYNPVTNEYRNVLDAVKHSKCMTGKFMENLVNAHMEKAGTTFLYTLMQNDQRYYSSIATKRVFQNTWLKAFAETTGLSENVIRGFLDNGVVYDISYDPNEARIELFPAMTSTQTQIGVIPVPVALAIIALVKLIAIGVFSAIENNQKIKAASESKKSNAYTFSTQTPLSSIGSEEFDFGTDFSENGGGNNGGGSDSGLDTTTMLLLAGAAYVALK